MLLSLTAADDDNDRRLDRILRKALSGLPLSAIHRLLRQGRILVAGEIAAAGRRVQAGETILINYDPAVPVRADESARGTASKAGAGKSAVPKLCRPLPDTAVPEILFEGGGLIFLNKPAGLAAHGRGSLEDQVLSYLGPKLPPSLSFRPGPLHRLDRPSSGIIVFSTNIEGARFFSALIRERKVKKFYLALVEGVITKPEIWRDELVRDRDLKKTFAGKSSEDAKTAITRVSPLAGNADCTLLLAEIETGRTHQIRAQAAARFHPLMGDKKYGADPFLPGGPGSFLLHAWRMEFPPDVQFPGGAEIPRRIEAPLSATFLGKVRSLFGKTDYLMPI